MERWESALDRWLTTPPEPDVVGKCAYCDAELYAGCEYTRDRENNEWFCDTACYTNKKSEEGVITTEAINNDA
jgi:hypothetical protein